VWLPGFFSGCQDLCERESWDHLNVSDWVSKRASEGRRLSPLPSVCIYACMFTFVCVCFSVCLCHRPLSISLPLSLSFSFALFLFIASWRKRTWIWVCFEMGGCVCLVPFRIHGIVCVTSSSSSSCVRVF
jgi:hypothetical protein